jgi:hypothetical protein
MESNHEPPAPPGRRLIRSSDGLTWEPYCDTGEGGNATPVRDVEAFARWFADWWWRRGRHLTDPDRSDTDEPAGGPTSTDNIDVRG